MYKIFNTEKSNVSYFIKPYSPTNENIPLGMFGNVENSQVQGVKCPSVSSAQSRIFEIKSFLDIEIVFGLDKWREPHFTYELKKKHPFTDALHNYVRNNILVKKEKDGFVHLQLISPYFLVTDDIDLEVMTLEPNVKMENCKYVNGAYYPYSWIRNTNSTYALIDNDKEAVLNFSLDKSFMKWVFNKKVNLNFINPDEKILNYLNKMREL